MAQNGHPMPGGARRRTAHGRKAELGGTVVFEAPASDEVRTAPEGAADPIERRVNGTFIRRDEAMRIMERAGHADIETTMRYVRLAESIGEGFGSVFPPLPPELCETGASEEAITSSDHDRESSVIYTAIGVPNGTPTVVNIAGVAEFVPIPVRVVA
jgi:hypothetical protein